MVHNRGTVPTFEVVRAGRRCSSFIDATFTGGVENLHDWYVSRDYNASDHNTIHFVLEEKIEPYKEHRPWHNADWQTFTALLDVDRPIPTLSLIHI